MATYNITPTIEKDYEDNGELHFILKDIHVSVANALRRTILTEIPVVAIRTEIVDVNQCNVITNTTRFHNEIVKQRLSTIPVITQDLEAFPQKYRLLVKAKNVKRVQGMFDQQYKPYEIGYISNEKEKIKISGKIKW